MEKQKNIPVLRFPEFKDAWEKKKLGEVGITIIDGDRGSNYPNGSDFSIDGYCLFLNAKNVTKKGFLFSENSFITKGKDEILRKGKLQRFDIVLTTRGSVGHIAYYDNSIRLEHLRINSGMVLIRVSGLFLNSDYLYKYFNSNQIQNEISIISFGSAQPQLTVGEISKLKIAYPALIEQQKLASFFTAVDNKLQTLKKKKTLLEQYRKGVMQKIFSLEIRFKPTLKDVNISNVICEFPDWEEKMLSEVVELRNSKYNPEKENSSVKCIELEHLASETGQLSGFIDGKNSGSIKNRFNKGDVLFGKLRPYLKKYLFAPFDGVCSSEIWVLKGKHITNEFLYFIVQTNNFIDLTNISSGSKMPRADWNVVSKGLFDIPTLPEQTKIANFLSAIDVKISLCTSQIEKTEQYKKGLLQKMFV